MKGYYELDSHFHGNDKIAIKHFVSPSARLRACFVS